MFRVLVASVLLTGCYGGSSSETSGTDGAGSTGPSTQPTTSPDPTNIGSSTTSAPGTGEASTTGIDPTATATAGSSGSGDGDSSSTGDPRGPTSEFCDCSTNNPAADAGSFEMCATMLPDGTGTLYEPPPYSRTSDADAQDGVPTGTMTSGTFSGSTVYPGITWDYWVYVPAQYDGTEPAALFLLTDGATYEGGSYATPTVLDNLIAEGAMPTTIAVFVDPGENDQGQSQRSLEYDTPDANYVNFVLDELLPATVGSYEISDDPAMRAIGGRSSGGSAAFIAGWERPDAFGLIYTTIGSFVRHRANAEGEYADKYPAAIAATDRKPLRVSLLSGINDLDNKYGNWRDAHMDMTTALDCAGYDYRSSFGESIHGDNSHPNHAFGADVRWLFAEAAGR